MTDKEIFANEILCIMRRAVGRCNGGTDCNTCDLLMDETKIIEAYQRAMKYSEEINRQQAEIEILIRKKDVLRDEIAEQQAEIQRLKDAYISDCTKCKHFDKDDAEYPCSHCKHNHINRFEPKMDWSDTD